MNVVRALASVAIVLVLAGASSAAEKGDGDRKPLAALPVVKIDVDLGGDRGDLEAWRQAIGHGGINSKPLPDRVVGGLAKLRPRLIRVFIQEFFDVYPEHGRFNWSRLDPYMEALAKTDAKVVAAITIKPKALYPKIDQEIWKPSDVAEWQRVLGALVTRYSVQKKIVTYWEIGNETDIGENGGCPYLIRDPKDYAEYYKMCIAPIVAAYPDAKVGGSGVANSGSDYLPNFIEQCKSEKIRLDFVSWHLYSDDPGAHAGLVPKYRKLIEGFGEKRPEMMVTEWSKNFEPASVEEMAFEPRRAAITAACLIEYIDSKVDWTFYYHAWDQVAYAEEFKPFFANPEIMYHHWNEVPHRFGLFGVGGEVRPQYFVYQMLAQLGEKRVAAECAEKGMRVLAAKSGETASVMIVNSDAARDRIAAVRFAGLKPGKRQLVVRRIDREMKWDKEKLELLPTERREVDVADRFACQVYCPGESVCWVTLENVN